MTPHALRVAANLVDGAAYAMLVTMGVVLMIAAVQNRDRVGYSPLGDLGLLMVGLGFLRALIWYWV